MKIFKLLKPYLMKYKILFSFLILMTVITWSITLLLPYISGRYVDSLIKINEGTSKTIYNFTLLLIVIWVFEIIFSYFSDVLNIKLQSKMVFDLNFHILEHVKRLPISFFSGVDTVYLNQRTNSDINTIVSFILSNCIQIFIKGSTVILLSYILFSINIKISILLLVLILLYGITYISFKKPLYKHGFIFKEEQSKYLAKVNEQLYNIKFIKMNSFYKTSAVQLKESFNILYKAIMNYSKLAYLFSSTDLCITRTSTVFLIFFGGFEILNGRLTIGNFTIISNYFAMLISCTSFFLKLGKQYQDTFVSYTRIMELLDRSTEPNGEERLEEVKEIKFEGLNFSYDTTRTILKDFSFKFEKGNIYGIVGRNGMGKSTLINLLTGLFNGTYSGEIFYNSINIKELDVYYLREKLIGVTEQEPVLMGTTIGKNLTYGIENLNDELVNKWYSEFGIFDLIANFPQGFDYNLNEKSSNISGGQKQKISQTRIFIKDPQVLILDEPTSALDEDSIKNLKMVLRKTKEERIIIMITHNSSMLDIVDEVINLEKIAVS